MDEAVTLYWHRHHRRHNLLAPVLLSIGLHLLLIAPLAAVFISAHTTASAGNTPEKAPQVSAATFAGQIDETAPDWKDYIVPQIRPAQIASGEEGSGEPKGDNHVTAPSSVGSGSGLPGVPGHRAAGWFAVPGRPQSIVYLIDDSLSMAQMGALDAARRELLVQLAELPRACHIQVMVYDRSARPLLKADETGLTAVSAESLTEATGALEKVLPTDGTNHFIALQSAMMLHPDVIVLVTDEVTDDDDLSNDEVRRLQTMGHGKTAVNIVELTATKQPSEHEGGLKRLSEASRGSYRSVCFTH